MEPYLQTCLLLKEVQVYWQAYFPFWRKPANLIIFLPDSIVTKILEGRFPIIFLNHASTFSIKLASGISNYSVLKSMQKKTRENL